MFIGAFNGRVASIELNEPDILLANPGIFVSVDNNMAGIAAAAHFPALTIPMGYRKNGQPKNITFITRSNNEQLLYNLGFHYERVSMRRKTPDIYR